MSTKPARLGCCPGGETELAAKFRAIARDRLPNLPEIGFDNSTFVSACLMFVSPRVWVTHVLRPVCRVPRPVPLYACAIAAGFPSPADDHLDARLDLNEHLIRHPSATFFLRVAGDSMVGAGIHEGDLLVVDRALEPADGRVVVAAFDGELTVKRLQFRGGRPHLVAENPDYAPLPVGEANDCHIWGVVTNVIHAL